MLNLEVTHKKCQQLIKKHYVDKGILFKERLLEKEILKNISPLSVVLDAGCGYDAAVISKYSDYVKEAVGVDMIKNFRTKPNIRTYTANLESLPFKNSIFDIIVSRDVCGHLINPYVVFAELSRVLKPGGKIIFITPNKYCYTAICSRLLTTKFKKYFLKTVFNERAYDNFPTYYRFNTKKQIEKIVSRTGLKIDKFLAIRHYPYYLMFSVALFKLGMLYDRFITAMKMDYLQSSFLVILSKYARD